MHEIGASSPNAPMFFLTNDAGTTAMRVPASCYFFVALLFQDDVDGFHDVLNVNDAVAVGIAADACLLRPFYLIRGRVAIQVAALGGINADVVGGAERHQVADSLADVAAGYLVVALGALGFALKLQLTVGIGDGRGGTLLSRNYKIAFTHGSDVSLHGSFIIFIDIEAASVEVYVPCILFVAGVHAG